MPTEYRPSGPPFTRDNHTVEPMAAVHICEHCGYENAAFGVMRGDTILSYCGWDGRNPVCVGKGKGN